MARPTTYTAKKAAEILGRVSKGEPLAAVCRGANMPAVRTVSDWRRAHIEFDKDFLEAREDGYDALAAEALRIADTPKLGKRTKKTADGIEVVTEDMLGHRRLQVETRLKLLAKWSKRYRENVTLSGDEDSPLMQASDAQISQRLAVLMAKATGAAQGEGSTDA